MRFSVVPLLFLLPTLSWAQAFEITSIAGASHSEISSASSTPIAYGGLAGNHTANECATPSSSSTCNNCVAGSGNACNQKRIHSTLKLRVNFKVVDEISGTLKWCYTSGSTTTDLPSVTLSSTGSFSQNDTGYAEVSWSEICNIQLGDPLCQDVAAVSEVLNTFITLDSSCSSATNKQDINVQPLSPDTSGANLNTITCADASPTAGYCRFWAYPGDRKAIIGGIQNNDIEAINGCPSTYTHARVYYFKDTGLTAGVTDFLNASYGSASYKDLPLDENCNPQDDWIIEDLENDSTYFFRMTMLDIAENNFFLTDDAQLVLSPVNGAENSDCGSAASASARDATCSYITTPSEVYGLLPEDLNCFISTAAYGSGFVDKIKTFRTFRNRFLLTNGIGTQLVEYYYQVGPNAARYISDKPVLRFLTRGLLWPMWGVVWLTLHYGIMGTVILLVGFVTLASIVFKNFKLKGV